MKYTFSFCFMLCIFFNSYAQQSTNIIAPSPQSKMFEKFEEPQVNLNRGTPEITIPLYEIEIKGLKIPISLTYFSGGIRYKQFDGDVAVGWALTPGYRVNRTIYGKPEEASVQAPGDPTALLESMGNGLERDKYLSSLGQENLGAKVPYANDLKFYDSEYDQFYYNMPQANGYFILKDRNNPASAELLDNNNIKVNVNMLFNDVTLTNPDGFKYNFGKSLTNGSIAEKTGQYNTSLPLMDILSPYNEQINFKYTLLNEYRIDNYHDQEYTITDAINFLDKLNAPPSTSSQTNSFSFKNTFYVSEISTPNEIVRFTRQGNGSVYEQPRIRSIEVLSTANSELLRKIEFEYEYLSPHYLLKSIQIKDAKQNNPKIYRFEYYPGVDPNTFYADQWGYYHSGGSGYNALTTYFHKEFEDVEYVGTDLYTMQKAGLNFGGNKLSERNANPILSNFYSLKKIHYPTGGSSEYIYEGNIQWDGTPGGGLRVAKIRNETDQSKTQTWIYKYGINEDGRGIGSIPLRYKDFMSGDVYLYYYVDATEGSLIDGVYPRMSHRFSTNVIGNVSATDFYMSYPNIVVYQFDEEANIFNGKTQYTFNQNFQNTLSPMYFPGVSLYMGSFDGDFGLNVSRFEPWKKSQLLNMSNYIFKNNEYQMIKTEDYEYDYGIRKSFSALRVNQVVSSNDDLTQREVNTRFWPYNYVTSYYATLPYVITSGIDRLSKKTTRLLDTGNPVEVVTEYQYNSKDQLASSSSPQSNGQSLITSYKYPVDKVLSNQDASGLYQNMVNANILSPIVEESITNNNKLIKSTSTNYGNPYPGLFVPSTQFIYYGDESARSQQVYYGYDIKGNVLSTSINGGAVTTYIWDQKNNFPIIEIKNADYSTVEGVLGGAGSIANFSKSNPSDAQIIAVSNSLRNSPSLKNAQITTYTYKPLIGMTSQTDPKGMTTYYEYDDFGRLKWIKDEDGNIVKENQYHYKN